MKRHIVLPVLLAFTHGCGCWYTADPPEVSASSVAGLNVLPSTVFVMPGALFVMRARIVDAAGGELPAHPQLGWTVGSGLTMLSRGADSVTLKAATPSSILRTTVTGQIGSLASTAAVIILAPNAAGTMDTSLADYRAATFPDVVLLDDTLAATPVDDSLVAFVGIGLLGNLSGGVGELARLARDQAFDLASVTWHPGVDVVDLQTAPSDESTARLHPPVTASFTVWIATADGAAYEDATTDVRRATRVFGRERTGIALNAVYRPATGSGTYTLIRGPNFECVNVITKLQGIGVPAGTFSQQSLNVVYVDDILELPSGDAVPVSGGMSGYSCPLDPVAGAVILISAAWRGNGTLTHELGHTMGLREPYDGHTLLASGFGYSNMMWPWETDAGSAPRSRFALGQAFRMNVDDHSWLQFVTGRSRNCDPTEVDRSCPPLAQDVR